MIDWMERVCKWRLVFTGWQLGTRAKGDPEGDAVRDHRELSIALRVEMNALTKILLDKKVCTVEELTAQIQEEARHMCGEFERKFPGIKATDHGLDINVAIARDTMAGWKP